MPKYELIPIENLIEPEIPAREAMDETKLKELCESVKEIGFIHPLAIVLVQSGQDSALGRARSRAGKGTRHAPVRYEIADGHRRYKVGQMLSHKVLPCLIFEDRDTALQAVRLHANLFREDLSVAEEAAFISDLIEKYDYTEEQLCRALHAKVSWVNERIGVLQGNADVFNALRERKINLAVAKQLNRVKDAAHTKYLLSLAVEGGATALTVSQWVSEFLHPKPVSLEGENAGAAVATNADVSTANPACFLCGKEDSPYQMEYVWIHPWEKQMLLAQIARAADVPPAQLAASETQNGGR